MKNFPAALLLQALIPGVRAVGAADQGRLAGLQFQAMPIKLSSCSNRPCN